MKHHALGKALLLAVCFGLLPFSLLAGTASAYGSADGKLIITHINVPNNYEGAAILLSGTENKTVGYQGNFLWWKVLVFDWDNTQKCFVLKEKNLKADGSADKSDMEIPQNGFAYALCVGNDYSASGGVNYITQRMKDCYAFVDTIEVGDKAFLYGASLADGKIKNNGKLWYEPAYESDSYISIGEPIVGETAYDPTDTGATAIQTVIKPNHVNDRHYVEADCNLFTPEFGKVAVGNGDFGWWTCAIFSWDASQSCYVCIAADPNIGSSCAKSAPIPPNGFVLLDCASAYGTDIKQLKTGEKAYLYQDGDSYEIALQSPIEGKRQKTPANAENQLAAPSVNGLSANGKLYLDKDGTVTWDAVDGATGYTVTVLSATPNPIGKQVLAPQTVTGTSLTPDSSLLQSGALYTLFLTADGDGVCSSTAVAFTVVCVSESAKNSPYRDKTVVAFGDSLTARPGWVAMLEGMLGTEVINSGVGGDTTVQGRARFQKDVLDKAPDVVLICFGMNDQAAKTAEGNAPNVSLETYRENMLYFITELQKIGADVVLITPHSPYKASGYYQPGGYGLDYAYGNAELFCEAMRKLAEDCGCGLLDINRMAGELDPTTILAAGDGIHQSSQGHAFWAEKVSEFLLSYTPAEPSDPSDEPSAETPSDSTASEQPSGAETSAADTKKNSFPIGWLIGGIALACAVVGGVVALVLRKRK